jgi:two-component system response regulator AtoC
MRAVRSIIERAAETDATVLIRGESGVGKDLAARAIHAASPRRDRPFVKVNCAALPAELLESELFGHERGAFTGAYRRKPGKFEFANSGTIFLDEIGELPPGVQPKLLQVLQDHEFARVGGHEAIRVDTRVIAATNRDLERALGRGDFREDLYYRLNVIEIHVPPLRERREEIPPLARGFLDQFNQQYHQSVTLSPETLALFCEYSWPGNVRELDNLVRRLVVLGNPSQIHEEIRGRLRGSGAKPSTGPAPPEAPAGALIAGVGLREIARRAAQEAERRALADVLTRVHWNRSEAARILKVSYKTLLSRIAEFQLSPGYPSSDWSGSPPGEPPTPP